MARLISVYVFVGHQILLSAIDVASAVASYLFHTTLNKWYGRHSDTDFMQQRHVIWDISSIFSAKYMLR